MHLFRTETNFNIVGRRRTAAIISALLLLIALAAIGLRGINFGLDFTGGTVVEVGYPQGVELSVVRGALAANGFPDAVVQHFGSDRDVLIRLRPREGGNNQLSNQVLGALETSTSGADLRRVEFVGPQVGEQLKEKGGMAMLWALAGILLYVAFRFEYRFAFGAVAALVHDVTIVIGMFALTQMVFDLTILAAILAVIGYSLNDTIVVFDRVRENFIRVRKGTPEETMNLSVNQTLARTLMTSITTLLVVLALFLLGGELIHGFAAALLMGVVVGSYSSVFVAGSAVLAMGLTKEDLIPPAKEGSEDEEEQP